MWYFIFWRGDKLIEIDRIFRKYRGRVCRIALGRGRNFPGLEIYDDNEVDICGWDRYEKLALTRLYIETFEPLE